MPRDCGSDLAGLLEASSLNLKRPPTPPQNLYLGPLPEDDDVQVPDQCVSILATGGPQPQTYIGSAKQAIYIATCQLRVRSAREDFAAGQTLAFGVHDVISIATLAPYLKVRVRESAPFYTGTDSSDRHQWVLNAELTYVYTVP